MDKIQAAAAEMGVEIQSTRVTSPPILHPGFNFYIEAFWRLHTCRPPSGSDVAWIPWTATAEYADRYGVGTGPAFYMFVSYIEQMDEAYRGYTKTKAEAAEQAEEARKERGDIPGHFK